MPESDQMGAKPRYNLAVNKKPSLLLGFCLAAVALIGCQADVDQIEGVTPASTARLTLFQTATQAPSQVVETEAPTPTLPPLPTATPFLYTVAANDTMTAIAVRFGVTLDELQAANPGVNPNVLSIGTQLVIPISFDEEDDPGEQIVPLSEDELSCTTVLSGGMWCFWLLGNPLDVPAENITGVIRLFDQAGEQVAAEGAVPLLNVLEPGKKMPLAAFFPPPLPDWHLAQGQLLSAVAVNQYAQRYLQGELEELAVELELEQQAEVSGLLTLQDSASPEYVWILAVAYDSDGRVVGVRRWEAAAEQLDTSLEFSLSVYSLGRKIETVEVLFEVRAANQEDPAP